MPLRYTTERTENGTQHDSKEVHYYGSSQLDKKCGLNTAQALIRKQEPSFAAVDVVEHEQLYKMTFEDFKKYGTPCDATEADED